MTCVLDIEAKERGGTSDSATGWSLNDLWRLPFALMLMLFRAFFRRKLDWLREQRRTRPQPKNWREHYDQLRLAEWSVIEVSEAGLAQLLWAQLLSGKDLNLEGIRPRDPPDDWHWPMPRSAFEMHRRIEAVVAFNTDPEGRIRRLVHRAGRRLAPSLAAFAVEDIALEVLPHAGGGGVWPHSRGQTEGALIRAPPWRRFYCLLPTACRLA